MTVTIEVNQVLDWLKTNWRMSYVALAIPFAIFTQFLMIYKHVRTNESMDPFPMVCHFLFQLALGIPFLFFRIACIIFSPFIALILGGFHVPSLCLTPSVKDLKRWTD